MKLSIEFRGACLSDRQGKFVKCSIGAAGRDDNVDLFIQLANGDVAAKLMLENDEGLILAHQILAALAGARSLSTTTTRRVRCPVGEGLVVGYAYHLQAGLQAIVRLDRSEQPSRQFVEAARAVSQAFSDHQTTEAVTTAQLNELAARLRAYDTGDRTATTIVVDVEDLTDL